MGKIRISTQRSKSLSVGLVNFLNCFLPIFNIHGTIVCWNLEEFEKLLNFTIYTVAVKLNFTRLGNVHDWKLINGRAITLFQFNSQLIRTYVWCYMQYINCFPI